MIAHMSSKGQTFVPETEELAQLTDFNHARAFIASGYGFMHLSAVRNTRDLGGMPTSDGRVIKPGMLLRSGELSKATRDDVERLQALGLKIIVDLRTQGERQRSPEPADKFPHCNMVFDPLIKEQATGITNDHSLKSLIKTARAYELGAEGQISRLYTLMATGPMGRNGIKQFFDLVIQAGEMRGSHAILWHCTAGKDRTGMCAAFLERALGVPLDLVMEDYLASNRYTTPAWALGVQVLGRHHLFPSKLTNLCHVLYTVEEESMRNVFAAIDKQWGSFGAYLEQEMGLDGPRRAHLQELYLTK